MDNGQKKSDIKIEVTLDENRHPVDIQWQAADSGVDGMKKCKAIMLSLFDKNDHTTMRIDLWTKEMMIEEMQLFIYETIASMADTYERSTNDKVLGAEMRDFATSFGVKTKILKER